MNKDSRAILKYVDISIDISSSIIPISNLVLIFPSINFLALKLSF